MSKAKYEGYEQLEAILNEALEQAAAGKGKERHANERSFEDQPMQLIAKLTGDNHGLAFQAIKKVQESLRLPDDRAERELLGAINYIAGMIIYLREAANQNKKVDFRKEAQDMREKVWGRMSGPVLLQKTICRGCGREHPAWEICLCQYANGLGQTIKPIWNGPSVTSTLGNLNAIDANTSKNNGPTMLTDAVSAREAAIPREEEDTIPLKHYNELLEQYTALEKRLQELN